MKNSAAKTRSLGQYYSPSGITNGPVGPGPKYFVGRSSPIWCIMAKNPVRMSMWYKYIGMAKSPAFAVSWKGFGFLNIFSILGVNNISRLYKTSACVISIAVGGDMFDLVSEGSPTREIGYQSRVTVKAMLVTRAMGSIVHAIFLLGFVLYHKPRIVTNHQATIRFIAPKVERT